MSRIMSQLTRVMRSKLTLTASLIGLTAVCFSLHAGAANTNVKPPLLDLTTCKKPEYPKDSIAKQEVGAVTIAFLVSSSGDVLKSTIKKSSGFPALDEAASNALKLCKVSPATKNGQATQAWMKIVYDWKLD